MSIIEFTPSKHEEYKKPTSLLGMGKVLNICFVENGLQKYHEERKKQYLMRLERYFRYLHLIYKLIVNIRIDMEASNSNALTNELIGKYKNVLKRIKTASHYFRRIQKFLPSRHAILDYTVFTLNRLYVSSYKYISSYKDLQESILFLENEILDLID